MVAVIVKNTLYRVFLPMALIIAALMRPSALSFIYAFLALLNPLFPRVRGSYPLSISTLVFLFFLVFVSSVASISQLAYQIAEHIIDPDDKNYETQCVRNSEGWRFWLQQAGFTRYSFNSIIGLRFVLPEILALVSSSITLLLCMMKHDPTDLTEENRPRPLFSRSQSNYTRSRSIESSIPSRPTEKKFYNIVKPALQRLSDILLAFFTVFVGIIQPSILNSFYFLVFLVLISWYAFYKPLTHQKFNYIKRILIAYTALHLLAIYLYQIEILKHLITPDSLIARVVGLSDLVRPAGCTNWWDFSFRASWMDYVNFGALWVYYFYAVSQFKWTNSCIRDYGEFNDNNSSVHEEFYECGVVPDRTNQSGNPLHGLISSNIEEGQSSVPMQCVTSVSLDRQKISHVFRSLGSQKSATSDCLISIACFCLYHSYVFVLLAMLTWALVYHSVFGLLFLVTACFLWALSDSRKWCFQLSPILLIYVELLLISQYVYSLNLVAGEELPVSSILEIIGFEQAASRLVGLVTLVVKIVLSLPFVVLLRLFLRERYYNSLTEHDRRKRLTYGTFGNTERAVQPLDGTFGGANSSEHTGVFNFFTKYWILLVAFVLLVNALSSPPVDYTVGYLILWCTLIISLHVSFPFFQNIIFGFWTLVIVYSSVLLIAVYTYQFPSVPQFWQQHTHLSAESFAKIGLVNYQDEHSSNLLFRLLLPILLVFVTMLQLKFFHDPWVKLVQSPTGSRICSNVTEQDGESDLATQSVIQTLKQGFREFTEVLWRLAEVYLTKLVLLILIVTAGSHICVLNLVLVGFISLAVCLPALSAVISLLLTVYLALSAVTRVVYLIYFRNQNETQFLGFSRDTCPEVADNTTLTPLAEWLGFGYTGSLFDHGFVGLIIVLVIIAIRMAVYYRQKFMRKLRGLPTPPSNLIFPNHEAKNFDRSLHDCVKFVLNYGFYKFGVEVSMIMMAIVAWTRMDLFGCIVIFWLLAVAVLSRQLCRALWPLLLLYLAIMLPLQYAMWIGLPQELCISYPWSNWLVPDPNANTTILADNLLRFLDLSNYRQAPVHSIRFLVVDFLLLLAVGAQECVFRQEHTAHPAGDNFTIYNNGNYALGLNNPTYDFVVEQKSFVDYFKVVVFMYGHWITLIMILVAGLGGTSLFALGYLVLAFCMLWQGNSLYTMRNYSKTLTLWNFLLFYTIFAMLCKVLLQVVGCVFLTPLSSSTGCIVRQLFSIVCVNEVSCNALLNLNAVKEAVFSCAVEARETRIGFDTIALSFIIFQLRVLHSWYFQHCMIDFRCEIVQSHRGALLINQLIEKEMKDQDLQQKTKVEDITNRTAAIRSRYEEQQLRGCEKPFIPQTYGQDGKNQRPMSMFNEDDPFPEYCLRINELPAKRGGDYYMFDYEPDTDELVEPVESFVPEVTPGAGDFNKLDPAQLLHTAMAKDMNLVDTLNAVKTAEKIKDEEQRMIEAVREEEVRRVCGSDNEGTDVELESAKVSSMLRFLGKIIRSAIEWTAAFLNRRSREHRYVAYVLNKEKVRLVQEMREELYNETLPLNVIRDGWESRSLHLVNTESDVERLEEEAHSRWEQRNIFAKLVTAIGNCIAAHTDLIAFILACIAHARCSGLITLPLPLLVFFWGSLASPRPSKTFWIVMIIYTEVEIIFKFIFQFGFFPWNSTSATLASSRNNYRVQDIFGVQKMRYFAFWDVALLIALFFHRYMLRRLGLWKDANRMDTFVKNHSISLGGENVGDTDSIVVVPPEIPSQQRGVLSSFLYKLLNPKFHYIRDLYPLMFFLDVFCFFIVVFGFSSFGDGGSGDVLSDISSNRVPLTFVIMLIIITLMIVVDRAFYLRKASTCKLIYQILTVVFLHIWIFFALPAVTKVAAMNNMVAQFLYIVKCLYFLISAWQIRNGYPRLCIGNLLTHSYGITNMVLFKIFMLIPFLFELRTAIDWTWTDTSMPILDFFSMENFYSTIYNLKCSRVFEQRFPASRGVPKAKMVKNAVGIPLILSIVLIIWFPLLAFALLNRIGTNLPPEKVQLSISLEGYPPIFTMQAQGVEIEQLTPTVRQTLINEISKSYDNVSGATASDMDQVQSQIRQAVSYIDDFQFPDIYQVKFRPVSEVFWTISTDSFQALAYQLNNKTDNVSLRLNVDFAVHRKRDGTKEPVVQTTMFSTYLSPNSAEWNSLERALMVPQGGKSDPVTLPHIMPFFLNVPNEAQVKSADAVQQVNIIGTPANQTFSNFTLTLQKQDDKEATIVWGLQSALGNGMTFANTVFPAEIAAYNTHHYVKVIMFVDRVFPAFLLRYAQGGIVAMYIALVLLVGRVIRGLVANQPLDVIINEIPNPDHLLKICLDIYLVREARDFLLEQDLYSKLIFLFRSPATLIKWTRVKSKND